MYGPRPAAAAAFSLKLAGLKGIIKKMLKCQSTCSMLVFVLKKTSQALDDIPEDHLHKKDSFTLERSNQHQGLFKLHFFDTCFMFSLFPAIIPAVAQKQHLITCQSS